MSPDYWLVVRRALLGHLVALLAPFVCIVAVPLIRWDRQLSKGSFDQVPAVRGDLPAWASWFDTPDERMPGNLAEPGQFDVWVKCGKEWAAWNWVGLRNRGHGFAFRYAQALPEGPWPGEPGYYETSNGLWWLRKPIFGGRWHFKAGWRHYFVKGKWWGVPCLTVTKP